MAINLCHADTQYKLGTVMHVTVHQPSHHLMQLVHVLQAMRGNLLLLLQLALMQSL